MKATLIFDADVKTETGDSPRFLQVKTCFGLRLQFLRKGVWVGF
jgi:hypothetical protein